MPFLLVQYDLDQIVSCNLNPTFPSFGSFVYEHGVIEHKTITNNLAVGEREVYLVESTQARRSGTFKYK